MGTLGRADRPLLRQGGRVTTDGRDICLACGGLIEPGLLFAASLRCHECRAERATLRAYPVEKRRAGRGPGAVFEFPTRPDCGTRLAA
jgi:hypothetical protein